MTSRDEDIKWRAQFGELKAYSEREAAEIKSIRRDLEADRAGVVADNKNRGIEKTSRHDSCEACEKAKKIIKEWTSKQSHERCWYYPDLFRSLANLFNVSLNIAPKLPPLKEFKEGCRRYQAEEFGDP